MGRNEKRKQDYGKPCYKRSIEIYLSDKGCRIPLKTIYVGEQLLFTLIDSSTLWALCVLDQ